MGVCPESSSRRLILLAAILLTALTVVQSYEIGERLLRVAARVPPMEVVELVLMVACSFLLLMLLAEDPIGWPAVMAARRSWRRHLATAAGWSNARLRSAASARARVPIHAPRLDRLPRSRSHDGPVGSGDAPSGADPGTPAPYKLDRDVAGAFQGIVRDGAEPAREALTRMLRSINGLMQDSARARPCSQLISRLMEWPLRSEGAAFGEMKGAMSNPAVTLNEISRLVASYLRIYRDMILLMRSAGDLLDHDFHQDARFGRWHEADRRFAETTRRALTLPELSGLRAGMGDCLAPVSFGRDAGSGGPGP